MDGEASGAVRWVARAALGSAQWFQPEDLSPLSLAS